MSKLTEAQLKRAIQTEDFLPVYLLSGDETYLIRHYAGQLTRALVGDHMPDLNLSVIEGENAAMGAVLEAANALPVMHAHRCVLVRDAVPANWSDEDLERLRDYLADPCPGNVVVFAFETTPLPAAGKGRSLAAACERYGGTVKLNKKTEGELSAMLCAGAGGRGCTLSPRTANYLIECVGSELNTLLRELDKLSAYCMGKEITPRDIDLLCSKTLNANAFQIMRQITRKNTGGALAVLQDLFAMREDPNRIMGALAAAVVNLYRALVADDAHLPPAEFAESLKMKNPQSLAYSLGDARRLGRRRLTRWLTLLSEKDEALKRFSVDGAVLLEQTVVELVAIAEEPA